MLIHRVPRPVVWPTDVPLVAIERDWYGRPLAPPPVFALVLDPDRLWLVAGRSAPATTHPAAAPGAFAADLWRHDVAELFVGRHGGADYLELNLAPNGAWWACEFTAPRVPRDPDGIRLDGVHTRADPPGPHAWRAALGIPLAALAERIGFDDHTTANVTFIVDTPAVRYASAGAPSGGAPDFHAPGLRTPVRLGPLG